MDAEETAADLFGDDAVKSLGSRRVRRGGAETALARAWRGQVAALRDGVKATSELKLRDALARMCDAVRAATDSAAAFNWFQKELEAIGPGSSYVEEERFDCSLALWELGQRRRRSDMDEHGPRRRRARESSGSGY